MLGCAVVVEPGITGEAMKQALISVEMPREPVAEGNMENKSGLGCRSASPLTDPSLLCQGQLTATRAAGECETSEQPGE